MNMWLYSQSSGALWDKRGLRVATGYSGFGNGKNNPKLESTPFVGPIPRGLYIIGPLYNSEDIGPFALPLTPSGHDMLGRRNFAIHGDSKSHPGEASKGCIILPRNIRELIYSADRIVRVIE